MANVAEEYDDFLDEGGHRWRKRLIGLALAAVVVIAAAVALWATVLRGESAPATTTQTTTVKKGSITKSVSTSAVAASQSTANLSFGQTGTVTAVNVKIGQAVKQGDVLTQVESTTLQDAVTQAQVSVNSAQTKLNTMLQGSTADVLASADQSVIQAQQNLDKANTALQDLYNPTSDTLNTAQQAVLAAQSQLTKAQQARANVDTAWNDAVTAAKAAVDKAKSAASDASDALDLAGTNLTAAENIYSACSEKEYSGSLGTPLSSSAQSALSAEASEGVVACSQQASKVLSANNAYTGAETAQNNADDAVDTAKDNLSKLGTAPDSGDISVADAAVQSAQLGLQSANDKLAALGNPSADDVNQAQQSVASADAALTAAQTKRDTAYQGSKPEDIATQRDQLTLAQNSLNEAKKNLQKAQLIAPFDGTVAALNVNVGDQAGGSSSTTAAIVLNTPNSLVLNVSVGESDWPNVKAGQSGIATFDAITGTVFPIVIDSVGSSSTTTQGVVTYQAKAHIVARQGGAATTGQSANPSAGQGAGGFTGRSGNPSAGQTPQAQGTPNATPNAAPTTAAQPAPGMNASVTIIVDQRQDVLLVPSSAIQRSGRDSVVEIQNDDGSTTRQVVTTGLSDSTNTEITDGLQEGQTVIIPTVSAATSASSASQTPTGRTGGASGFSGGGFVPGGARPGGD